jgi:hypothetical protein
MKNKRLLRISAILLVAAVLTTAVNAFMINRSQTFYNKFVPASVKCEIKEVFSEDTNTNTKSSIQVKNTGNTDAYIRVRLVFHWEDSKGNVVGRNMDLSESIKDFSSIEGFDSYFKSDDWVIDGDNYTYYYKEPVAPEGFTRELLKKSITMGPYLDTKADGVTYYYYPVIEVLAEAVQSNPAEAVEEAWSVEVGSNGIITGMKTT